MNTLQETTISCPYCGAQTTVLLNEEDDGQEYIEDCQVCCKPIVFNVYADARGELSVTLRTENDTY